MAIAARKCCATWRSSPAVRSSPRKWVASWRPRRSADLGQCRKVIATKDDTTFIEGAGSDKDIKGRINEIKAQIEKTTSDYDKEKLQERLAKLAGGVAIIRVGAATETELKEKKHRVEDALSATRAAVEEGIVPGGAVAFLNVIPALDKVEGTGDIATGVQILRHALEEPLRQLAENAGHDGAVVVQDVRRIQKEKNNLNIGFEVMAEEYGDMLEKGIIDPAKVVRSASGKRGVHRGDDPDDGSVDHGHAGEGNTSSHAADAGVLSSVSRINSQTENLARVYRPLQGFLLLAKRDINACPVTCARSERGAAIPSALTQLGLDYKNLRRRARSVS